MTQRLSSWWTQQVEATQDAARRIVEEENTPGTLSNAVLTWVPTPGDAIPLPGALADALDLPSVGAVARRAGGHPQLGWDPLPIFHSWQSHG